MSVFRCCPFEILRIFIKRVEVGERFRGDGCAAHYEKTAPYGAVMDYSPEPTWFPFL